MTKIPQLADLARKWGRAAVTILIAAFLLIPVTVLATQPDDDPSQDDQTPAQADQTIPPKPTKFDRVYDLPGRLDKEQFDRFHYDIGRLWDDGLPSLIYIRTSSADESQSQYFADQLRSTWNIESAPGADDGIVFLITIRETVPKSAMLSLSYGANVFPVGQMTIDKLNHVLETEATPRFNVGNVNGGMTYALRRILYAIEYTAPFPAERDTAQNVAHALAIPLSAIVTFGVIGLTVLPDSRLPLVFRRRRKLTSIAIGSALVVISLAVAVFGQSAIGSGFALTSLASFAALLWKLGRSVDRRRSLFARSLRPRRPMRTRTVRTHHHA